MVICKLTIFLTLKTKVKFSCAAICDLSGTPKHFCQLLLYTLFLPVLSADSVRQVSLPHSFQAGSIMCDLNQDSYLETDDAQDFSLISSRVDSFRGSSLVQQVPAKRLAQAGFYFTGPADRVRCFSCQKTVENWHTGDRPVQRHHEVMKIKSDSFLLF